MKNESKTKSIRVPDYMWEYLRVRAFETRTTRAAYIKNLIQQDMEKENEE